jgi:hypothetical protein
LKTTIRSTLTTGTGRKRAGQTVVFFLMVLVILTFIVIWNFDLHKILHVKSVAQNGGDSAALMACRWQGITLNMIGDLNIMHALALSAGDTETPIAITNIQARLCFVGPMIGFMASQQAAKNNGIYRNTEFDDHLREHAEVVRNDYPRETGQDGEMLFPEPYEGCWEEYADMLDLIADEGVAAGPENAHFYGDHTGGHVLLNIGFYEAIASMNWCWFYNNAPGLLESYRNFFPCWWPPLPPIPRVEPINSEIYGLGLTKFRTQMEDLVDFETVSGLARGRELGAGLTTNGMQTVATWYCYGGGWGDWEAIDPLGEDPFPISGTVRDEYNYAGADAAVRVETRADRLTPGARGMAITNRITWSAAAKPFGSLNGTDRPTSYGIVLPAYHNVRLIPIDAASGSGGGGYNLDWRKHIEDHLPLYVEDGPAGLPGCHYCNQLQTWENSSFRQAGVDWLSQHSYQCIARGGGGGGGRGGGTRRGH